MEIENIAFANFLINIPILAAVIGVWLALSGKGANRVFLALSLVAIAFSSLIPLPLSNWLMTNHHELMTSGQSPILIISSGVGVLHAAGLVLLVCTIADWKKSA
ncbi:hypothetical protein [Pseudomaricurvus alkylphenolicus]|uniref:hypothetical protein n=1 Tax=Pseudomaricurvus alkylphenolicus TaxID=1306991 RepID=UPI00141EB299|nr:hypothetical protein [Pseudomaricurvus alkylphenolicus]